MDGLVGTGPQMNLLVLEQEEIDRRHRVQLDGARARHLREVLKVERGSEIRVGVVDGPIGAGTVVEIDDTTVTLLCRVEGEAPTPAAVDLLLAVPRPKVLRRLWPQLAALGVGRIILTNAERVERPYFDTHLLLERHWRPLLIEGLQQARDTRLPRVSVHRRFRVLVEDELDGLSDASLRLVADPACETSIPAALGSPPLDARVLLAVGPEGGWNSFELELLRSRGLVPVGLGPRTLRSDTACIALLAIVHEHLRSNTTKR